MKYLPVLFAVMLFLGNCENNDQIQPPEWVQKMENAKISGETKCMLEGVAYNLTSRKWMQIDTMKYHFRNYPDGWDKREVQRVYKEAAEMWAEHMDIEVKRVDNPDSATYYVEFAYLDKIGGTMGLSDLPGNKKLVGSREEFNIIIDKYDVQPVGENGKPVFDLFTILLHEIGHKNGVGHSDIPESVMNANYSKKKGKLSIDDVLAVRDLYHNKETFRYKGHKYIAIRRDSRKQITDNFTESEFFTQCETDRSWHWLDSALIEGVQVIRENYNCAVKINSTYRDYHCNKKLINSSVKSQHQYFHAVDFSFIGRNAAVAHREFRNDIIRKRCIFNVLYFIGIRGFGGYSGHYHIDTRDFGSRLFRNEKYSLWGTLIPNAITDDPEHEYGLY